MADTIAAPVLALNGVRKTYGIGTPVETEVLHGIDMRLGRGEFCALIGPSGSGKSTLLNIIGLLDRPTSGALAIEGTLTGELDDTALTRLRGRSIGFVFQYHHLITAFSALENVMMPLLVERGRPDDVMRGKAATLLARVGLERWKDSRPSHLSGGQQQRVAVARALAADPALVLADEPTGNLDPATAARVMDLLQAQTREHGSALLLVTHSDAAAARADRVLRLTANGLQAATASH